MPQAFDEESIRLRIGSVHKLNQIVVFSDTFLVLRTEDYFRRCWCFYEWSAAVFVSHQVQVFPPWSSSDSQQNQDSFSFLASQFDLFHDQNNEPSFEKFQTNFQASVESDKEVVWANFCGNDADRKGIYDDEVVRRYRAKFDSEKLLRDWSSQDITKWLSTIRLEKYSQPFSDNQINGRSLFRLFSDDYWLITEQQDYLKVFFLFFFIFFFFHFSSFFLSFFFFHFFFLLFLYFFLFLIKFKFFLLGLHLILNKIKILLVF